MPRKKPVSAHSGRVGLRDIAETAGVCLMTVSLSLRDSPQISAPTRKRVQQIAQNLGYQPDPELSRLMKHLRLSRTLEGRTGLVMIDFCTTAPVADNPYTRRIRDGAVKRTEEQGFGTTILHAADYQFNLRTIVNVIRNRGIEGALLLPSGTPVSLDPSIDWKALSVVSTSNSYLSPRFHSVVPHQFANTMRMIEILQSRGYRKLCAIFDEDFDERTARNFTAAINWHGHGDRTLVVPANLLLEEKSERVARWIRRHQPDIIFAQASDAVAAALDRVEPHSGSPPVAVVGLGPAIPTATAYVDERPELVGAAAVDLLAGMMYYHETGIPTNPRTTMIDGEFRWSQPPKD